MFCGYYDESTNHCSQYHKKCCFNNNSERQECYENEIKTQAQDDNDSWNDFFYE